MTKFRDEAPRPRLLIVEDDELIAALLAEAVEKILQGAYEVSHTGSVVGARHLLLTVGVDALLLDYKLPDGTALAVLREADRLGVPVLVISGDSGAVAELARRGRAVLAKPFGAAELRDALRRLPQASARRGPSRELGPGMPPAFRPVQTRLGRLAACFITAARRGAAWGAPLLPACREHSVRIIASAGVIAMTLPFLHTLLRRGGSCPWTWCRNTAVPPPVTTAGGGSGGGPNGGRRGGCG